MHDEVDGAYFAYCLCLFICFTHSRIRTLFFFHSSIHQNESIEIARAWMSDPYCDNEEDKSTNYNNTDFDLITDDHLAGMQAALADIAAAAPVGVEPAAAAIGAAAMAHAIGGLQAADIPASEISDATQAGIVKINQVYGVISILLKATTITENVLPVIISKMIKRLQLNMSDNLTNAETSRLNIERDRPVSKIIVGKISDYLRKSISANDQDQLKTMIHNTSRWNSAFDSRRSFVAFFDKIYAGIYARVTTGPPEHRLNACTLAGTNVQKAASVKHWMDRLHINEDIINAALETEISIEVARYRMMRTVMLHRDSWSVMNSSIFVSAVPKPKYIEVSGEERESIESE